ncbi:MAG: hypothetical protein WAV21_03135 [Minisyncoccia bacterium]
MSTVRKVTAEIAELRTRITASYPRLSEDFERKVAAINVAFQEEYADAEKIPPETLLKPRAQFLFDELMGWVQRNLKQNKKINNL